MTPFKVWIINRNGVRTFHESEEAARLASGGIEKAEEWVCLRKDMAFPQLDTISAASKRALLKYDVMPLDELAKYEFMAGARWMFDKLMGVER